MGRCSPAAGADLELLKPEQTQMFPLLSRPAQQTHERNYAEISVVGERQQDVAGFPPSFFIYDKFHRVCGWPRLSVAGCVGKSQRERLKKMHNKEHLWEYLAASCIFFHLETKCST